MKLWRGRKDAPRLQSDQSAASHDQTDPLEGFQDQPFVNAAALFRDGNYQDVIKLVTAAIDEGMGTLICSCLPTMHRWGVGLGLGFGLENKDDSKLGRHSLLCITPPLPLFLLTPPCNTSFSLLPIPVSLLISVSHSSLSLSPTLPKVTQCLFLMHCC